MDRFCHITSKHPSRGFTLIELMIVVAIVGILAAVALPAYQDYTKRAHVSEGLGLAAGAKAAVADYYASTGAYPTTNSAAGLSEAIVGNAVENIQVSVTGSEATITITYNKKVDSSASTSLLLTTSASNGAIRWSCKSADSNGVDPKYLPALCRTPAS